MKDNIIFERVARQNFASQGEPYSNNAGYQIWFRKGGEEKELIFLGFVPEESFDSVVADYMVEGDVELFMMRENE